jgi:hypothetical protein
MDRGKLYGELFKHYFDAYSEKTKIVTQIKFDE